MAITKIKYCRVCDRDHKKSLRQYAHTYHYPNTICFARAAFSRLTENQFWAILAHEIGHLLAGYEGGERDANAAANKYFDIKIRYRDSANGEHLQVVTDEEVEKIKKKAMKYLNCSSFAR